MEGRSWGGGWRREEGGKNVCINAKFMKSSSLKAMHLLNGQMESET